ncbi:hypothetical protein V8C86DRAFT_2542326 [Haematococcus lacustris]
MSQTCAQCDTLTSELVLLRKERAEWQARYEALEREALEWQQDAHSTARKNRELQPRIAELSLQLSKERKQREALMQDKVACLVCWEAMVNMALACGHLVCSGCLPHLKICPLCRVRIEMPTARPIFMDVR